MTIKTPAERLAEIEAAGGFISATDLPSLIEADRLRLVLIRFTSGIRLTCALQYVAEIIEKMESTGEHCRDVQFSALDPVRKAPDLFDHAAATVREHANSFRAEHQGARVDRDFERLIGSEAPEPITGQVIFPPFSGWGDVEDDHRPVFVPDLDPMPAQDHPRLVPMNGGQWGTFTGWGLDLAGTLFRIEAPALIGHEDGMRIIMPSSLKKPATAHPIR